MKTGLDFRGRKGDMYCNFSQLRLGDPKGLPSFFAPTYCRRREGQPATIHQFDDHCPPKHWVIQFLSF
jgi:hypothetical protein